MQIPLKLGWALTIHKSQGATIDRAYILGSATMDRHLTYVAMTRHKLDARLYADHSALQKMRKTEPPRIQPQQPDHPRRSRGPTMH